MNNQLTKLDALSRALIGFDTMFDQMERRYANSVPNNYPPHNILKTGENQYEIQIAVTGFEKSEISELCEAVTNRILHKGDIYQASSPLELEMFVIIISSSRSKLPFFLDNAPARLFSFYRFTFTFIMAV